MRAVLVRPDPAARTENQCGAPDGTVSRAPGRNAITDGTGIFGIAREKRGCIFGAGDITTSVPQGHAVCCVGH